MGHFSTADPHANAGGGLAANAAQALRNWREGYMAEVGGRPGQEEPNEAALKMWDQGKDVAAVARGVAESGLVEGNRIHVLGPTDDSRRPFIVSNGDEEAVGSSLGWQVIVCAIDFVVVATVSTAFLLSPYGALG